MREEKALSLEVIYIQRSAWLGGGHDLSNGREEKQAKGEEVTVVARKEVDTSKRSASFISNMSKISQPGTQIK